jgi:hypothetical protein
MAQWSGHCADRFFDIKIHHFVSQSISFFGADATADNEIYQEDPKSLPFCLKMMVFEFLRC